MVDRENGRRGKRPSELNPSLAEAGRRGRAETDGENAGRDDERRMRGA